MLRSSYLFPAALPLLLLSLKGARLTEGMLTEWQLWTRLEREEPGSLNAWGWILWWGRMRKIASASFSAKEETINVAALFVSTDFNLPCKNANFQEKPSSFLCLFIFLNRVLIFVDCIPCDSVRVVAEYPRHRGLPDLLQLLLGKSGVGVQAEVVEEAVAQLQTGEL